MIRNVIDVLLLSPPVVKDQSKVMNKYGYGVLCFFDSPCIVVHVGGATVPRVKYGIC